jgi:hypothetical protein
MNAFIIGEASLRLFSPERIQNAMHGGMAPVLHLDPAQLLPACEAGVLTIAHFLREIAILGPR